MIEIRKTSPRFSPDALAQAEQAWSALWADQPEFLKILDCGDFALCQKRADEIRARSSRCVSVGIGGSSLGARVLVEAGPEQDRVLFLENSDPISAETIWRLVGEDQRTHWVWISKSGKTIETLSHLLWTHAQYKILGRDLGAVSTVVSDPGANPLTKWADDRGVARLSIQPAIGGRFSVFTPAGLLTAAVAGVSLDEVRTGISWALEQRALACQLMAAALDGWSRSEWVTLLWGYGDELSSFSLWTQQLWAESLAKKIDTFGGSPRRVSFPVPARGTVDQHSILQQVFDGARDKSVWFTRVAELENSGPTLGGLKLEGFEFLSQRKLGDVFAAQAEGTQRALEQVGVSTLVMEWRDIGVETRAAAMMLMQIVIAGLGMSLKINPYDQPGVESGKKLTLDLLSDRDC